MLQKQRYSYCGAVSSYGQILSNKWQAHTYAESESKARNNLAYQFRKHMGLVQSVPIKLTEEIIVQ